MKNEKCIKQRSSFRWITIAGLVLITILQGCKSSDDSIAIVDEELKQKLQGKWTVQSVNVDGLDKTIDFKGLAITFNDNQYIVENGGVLWRSSGTYRIIEQNSIEREDGITMNVSVVSETELNLAFHWSSTTIDSGRSTSIRGNYDFKFIK